MRCRNCGTENAADGWFCQDCGEDLCHRRGIQDTAPGSASRVNVQDANILKIQILHGHKLKVPFVGPILAQAAALTTGDPERLIMLADNRLPMLTTATVRMQSAAGESNLLASVEDVDRDLADALKDDGEGGDRGIHG